MIEKGMKLLMRACVAFAVFMLVISLCSYWVGDDQAISIGIFQLGSQGISNAVILEGFLLCLVLSMVRMVIDQLCTIMLWKAILSFAASGCISIGCILSFNWFPIDMKEAWFGFICSFVCCFGVGCVIMKWKIKKEDDEIQALFSQFTERRQHEHD